jgi:hypothetical protein
VFAVTAGTTYRIAVDGFSGATGTYVLAWMPLRSVSGTVRTAAGAGIPGVTVSCYGCSAVTDANGAYTVKWIPRGTYTFTPSGGGCYFTPATRSVTVSGSNAFGIDFTGSQAATNDMFASAWSISGTSGCTTGFSAGATKEPGEPWIAGWCGGASVWFYWTAPQDGPVVFHTTGSSFDTLLAVYTGSAVDALTPVANDNDRDGDVTSLVRFDAVGGTTYDITVDGMDGAAGDYTLTWSPPRSVSGTVSIEGEAGVPVVTVSCKDGSTTAGSDGGYTITGLADTTYAIGAVADGCSFVDASATIAGANVSGVDLVGRYDDMFADATPLVHSPGSASGSNVGATMEDGEPQHHMFPSNGASVWFSWRAPSTGLVSFDTLGSDFDTLMSVYTGSSVGALTLVAYDTHAGGVDTSQLSFHAVAGTDYRISVSGLYGATSTYQLNWDAPVPTAVLSTPSLSRSSPSHSSYFTITGSVTPQVAGPVRVYLYRKVSANYSGYPRNGYYTSCAVVAAGSLSTYAYRVKLPAGSWKVRAYYAGGVTATAGWSGYRSFTVR